MCFSILGISRKYLLFVSDIMSSSSSDGVKEANNVGVRRVKLMPWSEWLESEEEEVTNDVLVVMMQPGNRRGLV